MVKKVEDKKVIYETKVRVNLEKMREVIETARQECEKVGGKPASRDASKSTPIQRSKFHTFNTISKLYDRINNNEKYVIVPVKGTVSGASQRIYHDPSLTSYAKPFRECIEPLTEGNKFVFFDLKAAEFYLNCLFCNETRALQAYERGEDIYMFYSSIFPPNTPRFYIKKTLIANMYDETPYRVALDLKITENQARRLLESVAKNLPSMSANKAKVKDLGRRMGYYMCPDGVNVNNLIKACDYKPSKISKEPEFNELLALSAYVQSALGKFMQDLCIKMQPRLAGTLLTVFDSVLVECRPERVEFVKAWLNQNIKPFRTGKFAVGDNFLQVYQDAD